MKQEIVSVLGRCARRIAAVVLPVLMAFPAVAQQAAKPDRIHRPEHEKGATDGVPVAVLLYDGALVLDYGVAAEMFLAANGMQSFRVYTVARTTDVRLSVVGQVHVDYTFEDAPLPKVVIVPGGPLWADEGQQPETVAFLKLVQEKGSILYSVCTGAMLLGKAGLLSGRRATTNHAAVPMLKQMVPDANLNADANFVDDGNLVTAAGAGTAIVTTLHLIERLTNAKIAKELRERYLDYPDCVDGSDPSGGGRP